MTSYWKSIPLWRCPYCDVIVHDTPVAKRQHEFGAKHKEAVEQWHLNQRRKNFERQTAQDDLQKDLAKIEKAALASFNKHDNPTGQNLLPLSPTDSDTATSAPPKPEYASVSVSSSAPAYGTAAYAEWYYSWQKYHSAHGTEKEMETLGQVPTAAQAKAHANKMMAKLKSGGSNSTAKSRPNACGTQQGQPTQSSSHSKQPHASNRQSAPPGSKPSVPAPTPQFIENDDGELESGPAPEENSNALSLGSWQTVRVVSAAQKKEDDEAPSSSDEEHEEKSHNSDVENEKRQREEKFKKLSFTFGNNISGPLSTRDRVSLSFSRPNGGDDDDVEQERPKKLAKPNSDNMEQLLRQGQSSGGAGGGFVTGRSQAKIESLLESTFKKRPEPRKFRKKDND